MTLGEFIIQYRNEHNLSRRSFAEICGLSNPYVSMIENGVNNFGQPLSPTMSTYAKIASAVGIPINDFLQMLSGNVTISSNGASEYTEKEIKILNAIKSLSPESQDDVLKIISLVKGMNEAQRDLWVKMLSALLK